MLINWIPTIGVLLFTLLYVSATFYYPGGHTLDRQAPGFSWIHNYWCNLLDSVALNGNINTAQPLARIALIILCLSLLFFWWQYSSLPFINQTKQRWFRIMATCSLCMMLLLLTPLNHDVVTSLVGFFGLITMCITLLTLSSYQNKGVFYLGMVTALFMIMNGILYYHESWIKYLPVVQKITFVFFLFWIGCMNVWIINQKKDKLIEGPSLKS